MEIIVRIPDDLAARFGAAGDIERRALEALALDEFRHGRLTRSELKRLLGFATRGQLDAFLVRNDVTGRYAEEDLARDRADLERLGL